MVVIWRDGVFYGLFYTFFLFLLDFTCLFSFRLFQFFKPSKNYIKCKGGTKWGVLTRDWLVVGSTCPGPLGLFPSFCIGT